MAACVVSSLIAILLLLNGVKATSDQQTRQMKRGVSELYHSFDALKISEDPSVPSHRLHRRAANAAANWNVMMAPIVSFCQQVKALDDEFKLVDGIQTSCVKRPPSDMPDPKKVITSQWYLPEVRPVRVKAERMAKKVKLVFDVIHGRSAYVARVDSFRYNLINLTTPAGDSGGPIASYSSEVQFVADASPCDTVGSDYAESYRFASHDHPGDHGTELQVGLCDFDQPQDVGGDGSPISWVMRPGEFQESVVYPKYRLLVETKRTKVVNHRLDEAVDVALRLSPTLDYTVRVIGYDYMTIDELDYGKHIEVDTEDRGRVKVTDMQEYGRKLFRFDEVNRTLVQGHKGGNWEVDLVATVKLLTRRQYWGGRLLIVARQNYDPSQRHILRSLTSNLVLTYNHEDEKFPPWRMEPVVPSSERLRCDLNGSHAIAYQDTKNCTISCRTRGPGIREISIRRSDQPSGSPYRSASYILHETAVALIDVGPASPEIDEAVYTCHIKGKNIELQVPMKLYTRGFPAVRMEASSVRVTAEGDAVRAVCSGSGMLPLWLSVKIEKADGWTKNIRYNDSNLETGPDGKSLTVRLPVRELANTFYKLHCIVASPRGEDAVWFSLAPRIQAKSSTAVRFDNGTLAITCDVQGIPDLEVRVVRSDGRGVDKRIDLDPGVIRTENQRPYGLTVSVLIVSRESSPRPLSCTASNELGSDTFQYEL